MRFKEKITFFFEISLTKCDLKIKNFKFILSLDTRHLRDERKYLFLQIYNQTQMTIRDVCIS